MERDQLAIDRLCRVWAIVEYIAENPGANRRELAERYALSERQVQDDLRVIREDLAFPLVRDRGYRFAGGERVVLDFSFSEARVLISALRCVALDSNVPREAFRSLLRKVPGVFPLQLQPLMRRSLQALESEQPATEDRVFLTLAEALFEQRVVRLHLSSKTGYDLVDPEVEPELLVPYLDTWFLVGRCCQKKRVMMFKVDSVEAVTPVSTRPHDP